ncbi:MAG: TRAP transporter small permease subunit [Synechococcaceae cyanobacterium]|nr:TRAP transporter small permease subunit [Synechococcaceae cyanobacterium]
MSRAAVLAERIDALNRAAARLARWALLLMLALGGWNVVGRYVGLALGTNLSSNLLIEGQWYLFDLAFLLGLGYTLQRRGHVRVDVLQGRWGPRRRARVELAGTLALLLPFVLVVLVVSLDPTLASWRIGEASPDPGGLPRYWVKSLIPIGFLLLGLQGIAEVLRLRAFLAGERRRRAGEG